MSEATKAERQVGIFVFAGLLVMAALILHFGKAGDRFRKGFHITVTFSNAGGLIDDAQVLYSGVLAGKVDSIQLNSKGEGVDVDIRIFDGVQVREDAGFMIKQSGLLGDQHVVVVARSSTAPFLKEGSRVKGTDPFDFSDVASQAGEAIKKLNIGIDKLTGEVLNADGIDHIKQSVKNVADLTKKLQSTSENLTAIFGKIQKGEGTIGKLLTDDQLFEEAKRLIHNWRVHGLMYSDEGEERYPSPRKTQTDKDK